MSDAVPKKWFSNSTYPAKVVNETLQYIPMDAKQRQREIDARNRRPWFADRSFWEWMWDKYVPFQQGERYGRNEDVEARKSLYTRLYRESYDPTADPMAITHLPYLAHRWKTPTPRGDMNNGALGLNYREGASVLYVKTREHTQALRWAQQEIIDEYTAAAKLQQQQQAK